MDTTELTVVRQGMRVVGVPDGTEQFQRDFLQEAVNVEPAELVRALVPMEDAQASFQILRLSATSRLSHLLRTVPRSITCQAAANYDALVEWALASTIAGDGAAAVGLPKSDLPGARCPTADPPANPRRQSWTCQQQLHQRRGIYWLPRPGPGACCRCLRGNLPSLLERLPERPMASALIEELKIVATKAKRSQKEDAVGSSRAALATEEDPQGRGIGTLLVEAGAGGEEGAGGRGEGETGGRGRAGGAGVLDSENNGRTRWQPSVIGRLS